MPLSRITGQSVPNTSIISSSSSTRIFSGTANTINATTSSVQAWSVDSNGKFSISTSDFSHGARLGVLSNFKSQPGLQINANTDTWSTSNGSFSLYTPTGVVTQISNVNYANDVVALINWDMFDSAQRASGTFMGARVANGVTNGSANMIFGRRTGTSSFAESARFNGSGYLGIGTDNPLAQLQTSTDGIIARTKWLNVVTASRTVSGDTRQITVNSPGGEYYLEMFIIGLWPYSGDGYGVRKIEVAGFGSENRVTTITNTGHAGGANPTVTISASGGNLVVQLVYGNVYRFAAITRLVYGNQNAYVTINGTDN